MPGRRLRTSSARSRPGGAVRRVASPRSRARSPASARTRGPTQNAAPSHRWPAPRPGSATARPGTAWRHILPPRRARRVTRRLVRARSAIRARVRAARASTTGSAAPGRRRSQLVFAGDRRVLERDGAPEPDRPARPCPGRHQPVVGRLDVGRPAPLIPVVAQCGRRRVARDRDTAPRSAGTRPSRTPRRPRRPPFRPPTQQQSPGSVPGTSHSRPVRRSTSDVIRAPTSGSQASRTASFSRTTTGGPLRSRLRSGSGPARPAPVGTARRRPPRRAGRPARRADRTRPRRAGSSRS